MNRLDIEWAKKVIAEEENKMEEKKQAGREYKVGDKILIPHAEELLLKNWEVTSSRSALATLSMESLVEITWCGKEIEIIGEQAEEVIEPTAIQGVI